MKAAAILLVGLVACLPVLPAFAMQAATSGNTIEVRGKDALAAFDRGMAAIDQSNFVAARREFRLACEWGVGTACNNLATLINQGKGGPKDQTRAVQLYAEACAKKYNANVRAAACYNHGLAFEQGWIGQVDLFAAREKYLAACEFGSGEACLNGGNMLFKGEGGPIDIAGAFARFRAGCEAKNGTACFNSAYVIHNKKLQDPDQRSVSDYLRLSCQYGYEKACVQD